MDTEKVRKKVSAITIALILTTSTFTVAGALPLFPIQEAEAQGLQLRVSASEDPAFENNFFGSMIVQIVIDDPGATDSDDTTVGLQVKGTSIDRIHLADGLWYSFIAEQAAFLELIDLLSDGARDQNIALQTADLPGAGSIPTGFTVTQPVASSFIRDINLVSGEAVVELNQRVDVGETAGTEIFPTLPIPFFSAENLPNVNPFGDDGANTCASVADFDTGAAGSGCDWPFIRTFDLIETDIVAIRAASASVDLRFDDFPDSITSSVDRVAAYPVDAEVIVQFTDFMWNMNPVEEDVVTFVLNPNSGTPSRIIYQPIRNFGSTVPAIANADFFGTVFVPIDFDGRQVLELDAPEGINSISYTFFFDDSAGAVSNFTPIPDFTAATSGTVAEIVALTGDPNDFPVVQMIERDPNDSFFESIDEAQGSRSNVFTAANDRVASWDYFDIIASSPMTQHDGFTSVDRELYDSADRAVFTITDPDQNLRSRISETIDARESKNRMDVGVPIPIINTRTTNIFDTSINTVGLATIWDAYFEIDADGLVDGVDNTGTFVRTDANNDGAVATEDTFPAPAAGGEVFEANATEIAAIDLTSFSDDNDLFAMRFTPNATAAGLPSNSSAWIIDTTLSIADISTLAVEDRTMTVQEILDQVRIDNLDDGTVDQAENFLVNNARITEVSTGNVIGQIADLTALSATAQVSVDIPNYNLIQLDTTLVNFFAAPATSIVQIQVIDDGCSSSDPTVAFAPGCVIDIEAGSNGTRIGATQTVDFLPDEAFDTDGDPDTGDDWFASGVGPDGLLDPLTGTTDVGYDRDNTPLRSAVGSFRALDLLDIVNANGTDPDDTFVRFTILFLDSGETPCYFNATATTCAVQETSQTLVLDILGLSILFDPPSTDASPNGIQMDRPGTFSNLIYRLEMDEAGSNSSIFTASADFRTAQVFDTVPDARGFIVLTGDPVKVFLPERFIPPSRLAFTYFDEDIVNFFRSVSATFIYETRDGSIEWDRSSYSFGQDAFLTLVDEDLNGRPDATERFNVPVDGFVFFELGNQLVSSTVNNIGGGFTVDATFLETGTNTGTFVAQITVANTLTVAGPDGIPNNADDVLVTTQQEDFEANYIDIRDTSSITFATFTTIANIRTTLGDVVLDRAAYPPGAILFAEIHDNDFNTDVDIRETIDLVQLVGFGAGGADFTIDTTTVPEGTLVGSPFTNILGSGINFDDIDDITSGGELAGFEPIFEITIFQTGVGRLASILPVGLGDVTTTGTTADDTDRFGTGVNTAAAGSGTNVLPMLDRNGQPVTTAEETGPNTGIFEFEVQLPGPAFDASNFPFTLPAAVRTGTTDQPIIDANQPIQATYHDPADESGDAEDEEELATFLFNTARLRTDKLEYGLGDIVDVILEEPDLNLDSRSIDEIELTVLDIITDKFDTEGQADQDFGTATASAGISLSLPRLRETDFNSGVFQNTIDELTENLVDRGEDLELVYIDKTPSGGGAEIRIDYEALVVEILPEIVFDKEEYTPFDEIIASIVSPDSNQDPDRIESISILVSSSSATLGRIDFPETGPNTGIFEDDFDLTPDPTRFPGDLKAIREDGVTIEFRIDEDTVATKSVFINYHVGQVMFDKDAFRLQERGVMRVIDPDANRNPDTIDTTPVRFWSTTDRGGLQVVLRETGDRTGIFEEIITFTPDEESTGTRLRVSEGDTITAKYTDNTLPAPAALDAAETFTVEIEELFASALIGALVAPLERAPASEPLLVDSTGQEVTDVAVGSQVLVQSEISNTQTKKQPFAYIVQIKDDFGVVISLSWVSGELPAKDVLVVAQSWIPDAPGDYTVEIFVWEDVAQPVALSPVQTINVTVSR